MPNRLKHLWEERPLSCILVAGLFFRLLAVVFSKGFGMIDDHFLIIEQAQSWVDKVNVEDWLPQLSKHAIPPGFSYFYTGIHYLLFSLLQSLGMHDAQAKMYVVRLLHALYSLLTVYFGYRITERLTDGKTARQVGLLLSLLWFWPFLDVRNLIEVVCIPMLMWATWLVVKKRDGNIIYYIGVGLVLGLAFNIRFQTSFFSAGFLLALLLQKKIAQAFACGFGLLLCAALVQGGIDYYIWHKPFVEIEGYIQYNLVHAHDFINLPWFTYLLFFAGILVPPISLFLLTGFFAGFRKHLLLFLPAFIFLAFHSYFPNKQERFILPIMPFIIMLGIIGWNELAARKLWDIKYKKAIRYSWRFFYVLNTILLVVVSCSYTKRNRVESMRYLSQKNNEGNFIVDNISDEIESPRFYMQKWPIEYHVTDETGIDTFYHHFTVLPPDSMPTYILVYDDAKLQGRLAKLAQHFKLKYEVTIKPSFIDGFMHTINPVNDNEVTIIYKITGTK